MLKEKVALGGAIMAALAASLCCIGPLLFVLFGVGAFGAATYSEAARPYLMAAAVLLLAFAYYWTYFRREECAPEEVCATKPVNRAGRLGLWLATFAVILFSITPYLAAPLAARLSAEKPASEPENCCIAKKPAPMAANSTPATIVGETATSTFTVRGMSCASCEVTIKLALKKTPGVKRADVSYDRSEAVVYYDPKMTTPDKLREAIDSTGYTCELPK
jgi:mercuric ion transport protein